MASATNPMDVYATRLEQLNTDVKTKLQIATDVRDSLDKLIGPGEYPKFLARFIPVFKSILEGPAVFNCTNIEHKLRNCILDIIHRLPFQPPDALETYASELMMLLMDLVRRENEDNAVLCMKTIGNFYRNCGKALASQAEATLQLIRDMFEKMPNAVKEAFDDQGGNHLGQPSTPGNPSFQSPKPASPMMGQDAMDSGSRSLVQGMQSFKVLAECPIIVVSIFTHHKPTPKDIRNFTPHITKMLLQQAAPQERAHKLAKEKGTGPFTGVSSGIKNRAAFGDFITAQVKTMSFLAYILRQFSNELKDFLTSLPSIVVRLLKDCPRERSSARKELLVATRHIINFSFRKMFVDSLDELLDERVLIGDGLTVYETMRPLAYSTLADLIHHVRPKLTRDHIAKTIEVYTKNLHDDFPGTSFQTMSAKLLLNLAEVIPNLPDKKEARHFLMMILDAIAEKFASMNRQFENVKQQTLKPESADGEDTVMADASGPIHEYDEIDIFNAYPIKTTNRRERGVGPVLDNKFLLKTLVNGLKDMLPRLNRCNPSQPGGEINPYPWPNPWKIKEMSFGFSAEDVNIMIKLFREGAPAFRYYKLDQPQPANQDAASDQLIMPGKEERDLLEIFATVFHFIDPATFHEVFDAEMPHLYELIFQHTALLHIPQFFLASEGTSPSFCGMLLQFLMDHIEEVGSADKKKSQILLRLFKLSFMAVPLFPNHNEMVLLPHVSKIVTQSIQLSTTAEEPLNYFHLLRNLFRSIGGGRFEHLYKELLPLLEVLLEVLNTLLLSAKKPQERDLYVELCLTVPARLSNLLPHLNYLMKPLVAALRGGSELVTQGLRTLELCVENLTADYLDPIMAPVIDDLMEALWQHLKPLPYNHLHSHTTMRILGKLGGRNRKFLTHPPSLSYKKFADDEASFDIKLINAPGHRPFPLGPSAELAIEKLSNSQSLRNPLAPKIDIRYKKDALQLVIANIKLLIGYDPLPDDFIDNVRQFARDLANKTLNVSAAPPEASDRSKSMAKKYSQELTLRKLLATCLFAASIEELAEEALTFFFDVCRHFTIIEVGRAVFEVRKSKQAFHVNSGEGKVFLDTRVLADAISDALSSNDQKVRDAGVKAVKTIYDATAILFGSNNYVSRLPFFKVILDSFRHNCYEEDWYPKYGGCLGIQTMFSELEFDDEWLVKSQQDVMRALIYVIKDLPPDLPASTRIIAQTTIDIVLRKCNKKVPAEGMMEYRSPTWSICALLVPELSNSNKHVRETAKKSFETLAGILETDLHTLIAPVKDRLLKPIFNKPLRALPFASQIGYIDAITFCLALQQNLLEFDEEMMRLLYEALALADADDEQLTTHKQTPEYRTTESVLNLRVVCIKLLSMSVSYSEFSAPQHHTTRGRIISVFFKSLYSRSPEVIEAANQGLKGVLQQTNKLPKELLQNGLRPILMNLSDPKRLNVAGLEGLARLLQLLTNYFKVEIGSRLLDHLRNLADPGAMHGNSFRLLDQHAGIRVMKAILNIFHLLPPAAVQFMADIFSIVLDLEAKLRRTRQSPFRKPLLQYVSRFPQDTWKFLAPKMRDMKYGRLLAQITMDKEYSTSLREVIMADIPGLLENTLLLENPTERAVGSINLIHLIHSLIQYPGVQEWLVGNRDLLVKMLDAGIDLRKELTADRIPVELRLPVEEASSLLIAICTTYCSYQIEEFDFLFKLIAATANGELKRTHTLTHYIYEHIICSRSVIFWRKVVLGCLEIYSNKDSTQQTKSFVFHYIVNPIFAIDAQRGSQTIDGHKLIDKAMIEEIHNKIWKPNLNDLPDDPAPGLDHARMETLQMSALLIQEHPTYLEGPRKDVIKFGWNYLKLEDIVNKQAAYVLVAYFIANFETPSKIVMQVYVALLKAHQNEARALVTQALGLIAPVLPIRLPGDPKYPLWARWPRRILAEDGHNPQQMTNIFQFLVKHGELFYEPREHFVSWIVSSIPKLSVTISTPSTENKKLSVSLINLLWFWEQKRVNRLRGSPESPKKLKNNGFTVDSRSPSQQPMPLPVSAEKEFTLQPSLRAAVIRQLIKFICTAAEPITPKGMLEQSLTLLGNLLGPDYWNDTEIDFSHPQQSLVTPTDISTQENITKAINALQVLRVIFQLKPDEWIVERVADLQALLDNALRSKAPEIHHHLEPVLGRILQALPKDMEDEEEDEESRSAPSQFIAHLNKIIADNLGTNPVSSVCILWTLSQSRPPSVDEHLASLMKTFPKLAKDHLSAAVVQPAGPIAGQVRDPTALGIGQSGAQAEAEVTVKLLVKMIDVASSRVAALGDQRRAFLSVLAQLVEKSNSTELCLQILKVVDGWVFNAPDGFPTLKEKGAVILKMLSFEHKPDPALRKAFLDLVIRIYEDEAITKTDLTVRLEAAFLVGTRAQDVDMRNRFLTIFDRSLSKTTSSRVQFLLGTQNWDQLGDSYWLHQATYLLLGCIESDLYVRLHPDDIRVVPVTSLFGNFGQDRDDDMMSDDKFDDFMAQHRRFYRSLGVVTAGDIIKPLGQLQHLDSETGHRIWVTLFPLTWSALGSEDRRELNKGLMALLAKDYHHRQMDNRPNVIQSLLEGIDRARPIVHLPHHMVKFLAKTFDAWYTAIHLLESAAADPPVDSENVRESNLDALVEMYASLGEDDMFYGLWRRRSQFLETNAALSFEQNGIWLKAQSLYETAQIRARSGNLPFSQSEYMLWEDHWIQCARKLQQWEVLSDFANQENYNDLLLECVWRVVENWGATPDGEKIDQTVKSLMDTPTPRRYFFSAFMALQKLHTKSEVPNDFSRLCDEAIQLSLRKWHNLPKQITNMHIPLLHNFQQLVELHDAHIIYNSLSATNSQNLDQKSQELKLLLGIWRDRLPNKWDDIDWWNDLVTWRQHIFTSINNTYLPLLPPPNTNGSSNNNSYAYRGYHETAWIINRFAHVARKHSLYEVCTAQLSKIYMLPNIEIQEAFLKLREQAICCYYSDQLTSGLEVINNTNLNYFGNQQKAEFYTLKGMFLSKLKQNQEANEAFSMALYHDLKIPKAWAEWGAYSDTLFKEEPNDIMHASNAISCYQEAAGLYKNEKSRKLLGRVLWLLSLDDAKGTLLQTFDKYQGEVPVWHWISYIPQLLSSLAHREWRVARILLINIAKNYPQALYFLLRTSKEEYLVQKKQQSQLRNMQKATASPTPNPQQNGQANGVEGVKPEGMGTSGQPGVDGHAPNPQVKKTPAEITEEIMSVLKTAFPLLALSMEGMGDQISKFFKCPPDEDAYRLIVALLNDGLQYIGRQNPRLDNSKLTPATESNITRFAETILPGHIRIAFEEDFVKEKPDLLTYIDKLRRWRDRFEEKLDQRAPFQNLESISPHLSEFRFQKFDDVEVPGQYLQHRDDNKGFIRIDRFLPIVDLVRGYGVCHRRLRMRGHDGSVHAFAVQHPAARSCRREERTVQLFRIFNRVLSKKKESRKRILKFHLPLMVPLAPHLRLVEDDASYISLQGIYEDHCRKVGMSKDEPVLFAMKKVITALETGSKPLDPNIKLEIFYAIQREKVPSSLALRYLQASFPSFTEFYLFRRQFTYQYAALTFLTYIMSMGTRFPHKMFIARETGNVWGTDLVPALASNNPAFHNPEMVPFRFTPNIQTIMGPIAIEGIYSCAILAIARCLTQPEFNLESQLSIFVRDEMIFWFHLQHRRVGWESQLRDRVEYNSNIIVRRATALAQAANAQSTGTLPANQAVIDLIAKAVNPKNLSQTDYLWMAYV